MTWACFKTAHILFWTQGRRRGGKLPTSLPSTTKLEE